MFEEDYQIFLSIIELIKENKLDNLSKICFVTGLLAGINNDAPDVAYYIDQLPELVGRVDESSEVESLIGQVKEFNN